MGSACREESGAEGRLGIEATSFYCGWGFFFSLSLMGVQVYFLVVSIILSLWEALGVYRSLRPNNSEAFLERVDVKPCSISFSPATEGMLQWAHNPAGFQTEKDANQPPSVIFARLPPRLVAHKIPGLLSVPF